MKYKNRTEVKPLQYLCRHYIDIQQVRIGLEHRIRFATEEYMIRMLCEALNMDKGKLEEIKFIERIERTYKYTTTSKGKRAFYKLIEKGKIIPDKNVEELLEMLRKYKNRVKNEEKLIVNEAKKLLETTALFEWCEGVRGLATISAMEFLGFINIYVPTGGNAKAYMGLIPDAAMKSGANTKVNWEAKGKGYLFARNVIMKRDEYYYTLYSAKKWYYANRSRYAVALKEPSKCPYYNKCIEKLKARAEREGREPKSPACKAHIDGMAKRWLAGMLVEHMWEVCRLEKGGKYVRGNAKGWDIPLHKMHIPPKPKDEKEMEEILKIAVPLLREGLVPEVNLGDPKERKAMLKYLEEIIKDKKNNKK